MLARQAAGAAFDNYIGRPVRGSIRMVGSPTPAKLLSRYSADILVFGHTHRALVEREGKRLVVNPGAAGPRRFDVKPSVAILRIVNSTVDVQIVPLTD